MTNSIPARADKRALFGAAALGSCLGLALGGAYLAGGLARAANSAAPAPMLRATVDTTSGAIAAPAAFQLHNRAPTRLVPAVAPFSLRGAARTARDQECLSQAVYYEARGEGETGMAAVAQVVLNRVRHPHFPKSVCAVVFQDCQFSFVCDGSVRRGVEVAAWKRAERIARRALDGAVMADVGAATDFRVSHIPASGLQRVVQIGSHVFYRFTGRLGQAAALSGRPLPSTGGQIVKAAFAAPSAEQVIAAGAKAVERAAVAMVGAGAHAPAAPTVMAPIVVAPVAEPAAQPVKPVAVKASEAPAAPASTATPAA